MRLTERLLRHLNRVFDKDPDAVLALRVRFNGSGASPDVGMTWRVAGKTLTLDTTDGGAEATVAIDLSQHTIGTLAVHLAGLDGFEVPYLSEEVLGVSALSLLDASGDQDRSNGDHITAYTSVLWAYAEALAEELEAAETQVGEMLRQMQTNTAEDEWLDELGRVYSVPRLDGEPDAYYGPRIIREVLRPRSNNVAMAQAIKDFTGQDASVVDVTEWGDPVPAYDGLIDHDGTYLHDSSAKPIYGLFDVTYGYDLLNGGSFSAFQTAVTDLVNRLRAAGTHLRSLLLQSGAMEDMLDLPEDGATDLSVGAALSDAGPASDDTGFAVVAGMILDPADALPAGAEDGTVSETYATWTLDGSRLLDGSRPLAAGETITRTLDGALV